MALADMFLKVEASRSGAIKGEASDSTHKDEIEIIGWSWGMRAQTEMGGGGSVGKSTMREVTFRKRIDAASTALLSAQRSNDLIKKAVLSVRKAGGESPVEYFKITLQNGRVTSIDIESAGDEKPEMIESLTMSFQKISVEYTPQGADGQKRGGMLFEAESN